MNNIYEYTNRSNSNSVDNSMCVCSNGKIITGTNGL